MFIAQNLIDLDSIQTLPFHKLVKHLSKLMIHTQVCFLSRSRGN